LAGLLASILMLAVLAALTPISALPPTIILERIGESILHGNVGLAGGRALHLTVGVLLGLLYAVSHMGTGRLQTIRRESNPLYYEITHRFGEATGVPVLLNTSFNLRAEPIVTTPENAFNTFNSSNIDLLVLENYLVSKDGSRG
jgi:carbamoyltransferase